LRWRKQYWCEAYVTSITVVNDISGKNPPI
jgi:hypothetical protein